MPDGHRPDGIGDRNAPLRDHGLFWFASGALGALALWTLLARGRRSRSIAAPRSQPPAGPRVPADAAPGVEPRPHPRPERRQESRPERRPDRPPEQPPDHARSASRPSREPTDIRFGRIVGVLVGLGICLVVADYAATAFLNWRGERPKLTVVGVETPLPEEPRLEQLGPQGPATPASYAAQDSARRRRLGTYGATDDPNFVHVPIAVAIERLAAELKATTGNRAVRARPEAWGGGESNSGRLLRGERHADR